MGPAAAVTSSAIMGGILGWGLWYLCGDREQQKAIFPLVICAGGVIGALVAAAAEIVEAIDRWGTRLVKTIERHAQPGRDKCQALEIEKTKDTRFSAK